MGKKTILKQEKAREEELKLFYALCNHKKDNKKVGSACKKKTWEEVDGIVSIPEIFNDWEIRNKEDWKATSHNIEKQQISYIKHLFVKYPVPNFFYELFIDKYDKHKRHQRVRGGYTIQEQIALNWFLIIAQGGSFKKEASTYFTSKEAHLYLNAPNCYNWKQNFWWTKCKAAGIHDKFIRVLIDREFALKDIEKDIIFEKYYKYFILFFNKYQEEMDKDTLVEILDYLRFMRAHDYKYTLKGRTLGSVIKQSNAWHRQSHKLTNGGFVTWKGSGFRPWTHRINNRLWEVKELTDSKELYKEGQVQKHCVGSYVRYCTNNTSFIFTVDSAQIVYEDITLEKEKHITLEVRGGRVVQMRGKFNRTPTKEEKDVIRIWAGSNGLVI